jgi:hypothetical protein
MDAPSTPSLGPEEKTIYEGRATHCAESGYAGLTLPPQIG